MGLNYSDIINADESSLSQEPVRVLLTFKVTHFKESQSSVQKHLGKKLMTDSLFNHLTKTQNM